jgi:hypothetical protein
MSLVSPPSSNGWTIPLMFLSEQRDGGGGGQRGSLLLFEYSYAFFPKNCATFFIKLIFRPIAPSYKRPNAGGEGGSCGGSANEYSCAHRAQINYGDLTPYLTNGFMWIYLLTLV